MQDQPGGLVGHPELGLELQSRDAVGVRGHQVGGEEPLPERQVRSLHNRPGDDGSLPTTARLVALARAFEQPRPSFQAPGFPRAAARAHEAARPPLLCEVFRARIIVAEGLHELFDRRRLVVLPTGRKQRATHADAK